MNRELLNSLKASYQGEIKTTTVTVNGHEYFMQSIEGIASTWVDQFVDMTAKASFMSLRVIPTLAVAIRKIDGVSVERLFLEDESEKVVPVVQENTEAMLKAFLQNFIPKDSFSLPRFQAAKEFKAFLESPDVPAGVVDQLWQGYLAMSQQVKLAVQEAAGESAKTFRAPDGEGTPNAGPANQPDGKDGVSTNKS